MSDLARPHDAATGAIDEPFWRALAEGVVVLPRCTTCGRWIWPAQPICPSCHTATLEWLEIEPDGVIYSWSRVWYPFVPERPELPYVVVVVDVPAADGCRIIGVVHGADGGVQAGAKVRGHIMPPTREALGLPSLCWELVD